MECMNGANDYITDEESYSATSEFITTYFLGLGLEEGTKLIADCNNVTVRYMPLSYDESVQLRMLAKDWSVAVGIRNSNFKKYEEQIIQLKSKFAKKFVNNNNSIKSASPASSIPIVAAKPKARVSFIKRKIDQIAVEVNDESSSTNLVSTTVPIVSLSDIQGEDKNTSGVTGIAAAINSAAATLKPSNGKGGKGGSR